MVDIAADFSYDCSMAYNTTTQTTGNLKIDRWVTKDERWLSGARRAADRFAIAEQLADLEDAD